MEMRRRTAVDDGPPSVQTKNRRKRPVHKRQEERNQPILSTCSVISIVFFFIAAGFLQHHYNESRARDPLGGVVSLPNMVRPVNTIRKAVSQAEADLHHLEERLSSNSQSASLLTMQEDASLERDKDGIRYHLVFSTDCSPYQHWQSYLVYYSAMLVRQPGHVTRIASGCEPEEAKEMEDWFQTQISGMSKRFHLQLTPHFSSVKDETGKTTGDYKFFNKPFGLKYWLENSPQLQYTQASQNEFPSDVRNDIVILIDPDMGLIRPITRDFSNDEETVIAPRRQKHIVTRVVGPGKPAAQVYGFGAQWARLDLAKVTGTPDTPAAKLSNQDANLYYPVGPPYLGTVTDMHRISEKWTEFVPKVHQQYPHLLAEMFAFSIAAAHLDLPFQLISSLMVSDVGTGGDLEGWNLVEKIGYDQVCSVAKSLVSYPAPTTHVPQVVHLCQRYGLGADWFFTKRKIPAGAIYECTDPLFAEPPDDLPTKYDFKQLPPAYERKDVDKNESRRMSFMLCYIYRLVNEAATFYKKHACKDGSANLSKSRMLVQYMKEGNHH